MAQRFEFRLYFRHWHAHFIKKKGSGIWGARATRKIMDHLAPGLRSQPSNFASRLFAPQPFLHFSSTRPLALLCSVEEIEQFENLAARRWDNLGFLPAPLCHLENFISYACDLVSRFHILKLTNWQDRAFEKKAVILSKFLAPVILYSDTIVHLLMRPPGFWGVGAVICIKHGRTYCVSWWKNWRGVNERESKVTTYSSSPSEPTLQNTVWMDIFTFFSIAPNSIQWEMYQLQI